jgi:hypothetical protein
VQLGAKLRLWSEPGGAPVLSVLPTVNLPTASAEKGLGSGSADYTLALLTGTDIGRHGHVDVNYGVGAIGGGESAPHYLQHLVSVSASIAVSDNWNPYAEAFWFSRQEVDGGGVTAVDAGAIYELGARYALDGGLQFGVSRNAPSVAAFAGVSVVVGDILGNHGVHARQRTAQVKGRQHEERQERRRHEPANHDDGQRFLNLGSDAVRQRHRHEAKHRQQRRHEHRPETDGRSSDHRVQRRQALRAQIGEVADHDDAVQDRLAEERDESDRGRDAHVYARQVQRDDAADRGQRNVREDDAGVLD